MSFKTSKDGLHWVSETRDISIKGADKVTEYSRSWSKYLITDDSKNFILYLSHTLQITHKKHLITLLFKYLFDFAKPEKQSAKLWSFKIFEVSNPQPCMKKTGFVINSKFCYVLTRKGKRNWSFLKLKNLKS